MSFKSLGSFFIVMTDDRQRVAVVGFKASARQTEGLRGETFNATPPPYYFYSSTATIYSITTPNPSLFFYSCSQTKQETVH